MADYSISEYIQSKSTKKAKLKAIDNLIDAMESSLLDAVGGMGVTVDEYSFDDGQVKIRTKYRSIEDINAGITSLEVRRNKIVNQLVNRCVVLRDVSSM